MTRELEAIKPQLDRIIKRIVKAYRPQKIILFGSYACGQPHDGSDVDLLIVKEGAEPPMRQRYVVVRKQVLDLMKETGVWIEPHVMTPGELAAGLKRIDCFYRDITEQGLVLYDATTDRRIGPMAMAS
jgi:uncharacterized protein